MGNLVTRLLQPCNKVVTISNPRFLPGCHKLVTRLSQPGDKVGTTIYYNLVTTLSQTCYNLVTRLYNFISKVFARLSQPGDKVVTTIYYNLVFSVWACPHYKPDLCIFNANSQTWFESTRNPLQSRRHYRFVMRIGSVTDCTCMHAALTSACDCHMTRQKNGSPFRGIFVALWH